MFPLDILPRKGYTVSMKRVLTDRQTELAIVIREATKTPRDEAWGPFTDFTRSIAEMTEGAEVLIHPAQMQKRFARGWESYARLWESVHNQIVRDCLGSQEEFVRNHPKGRKAIQRILSRVRETYGGLTPGMTVDVKSLHIEDILSDELGET